MKTATKNTPLGLRKDNVILNADGETFAVCLDRDTGKKIVQMFNQTAPAMLDALRAADEYFSNPRTINSTTIKAKIRAAIAALESQNA